MITPEASANLEKARQAYLQRRSDLQDIEKRGTKCLAVAGSLGLALVAPVVLIVGSENLRSAIFYIDWTSFRGFYTSAWQWMQGGNTAAAIVSTFSIVYCLLVWHWLAELRGWSRMLGGKALWAVSSGYFFIQICVLAYLGWKAPAEIPLFLFALLIPTFFLRISMGLWRVRKLFDENPPTSIPHPPNPHRAHETPGRGRGRQTRPFATTA